MIKKTLLLATLALLSAFGLRAQESVGDWTIYPLFSATVDKMVSTPGKIYYLSSGNLYSYSTDDDETYVYNQRNKLNDSSITGIYYNPAKKYLAISYASGNIDLLYDNGRSVNLSDIRDTNAVTDKTINHISFGKDRMYVATSFGMVVFDDGKYRVIESGIYDTPVHLITELGDNIVLYSNHTKQLYTSPKSNRHNSFDKFTSLGGYYATNWLPLSDSSVLAINNGNLWIADLSTGSVRFTQVPASNVTDIGYRDGGYYASSRSTGTVLLLDGDANVTATLAGLDDVMGNVASTWHGESEVWYGDADGIACYSFSGDRPAVVHERYKPEAFSCVVANYMMLSPDQTRLYVSNQGPSFHVSTNIGDGYNIAQTANYLNLDGRIVDITVQEASVYMNVTEREQSLAGNKRMFGGPTRLAVDPDDPEVYYQGNGLEGLYVVRGNKEIHHFTEHNSPMHCGWGSRVYDVKIDPEGNLWMGFCNFLGDGVGPYWILPAAKRRLDPTKLTAADWIEARMPENYYGGRDMTSLFCSHSNTLITLDGGWESGICVINHNGTLTNPKDDVATRHTEFLDQDGNKFKANYYVCMAEDHRGRVWVGTTQGIFEIANPSAAVDRDYVFTRLKVPRNDGTNYADYLLETDKINGISVDNSNRKWVATEVSGVYLVSENGDRIISHFTAENSYLPTNTVYSVVCDPNSNKVYFGTAVGVVVYNSTSAPASPDYSEVYAFPNPVRPDYTGLITVAGLMDNSLVKIADAAGNVFFQGRSEGGMITWDGCNASGNRVRTGVYFVYASQTSADGSTASNGVVTKILVVN